MSGFLSRVAARAVGAQASAGPRPAALYESAPGSELVELAGERDSSRPATPARQGTPHSPAAAQTRARMSSPPAPRRAARHEAEQRPPAPEPRVERSESSPHLAERLTELVATTQPSSPSLSVEPAATVLPLANPPPPTGAPPTGAPPIVAAPNAAFAELHLPPVPAAAERRPEVRVHIGRLEVRANLQHAPPPPRREPQRAPELSLTDYLSRSPRA